MFSSNVVDIIQLEACAQLWLVFLIIWLLNGGWGQCPIDFEKHRTWTWLPLVLVLIETLCCLFTFWKPMTLKQ